jgi:hypothetical protein
MLTNGKFYAIVSLEPIKVRMDIGCMVASHLYDITNKVSIGDMDGTFDKYAFTKVTPTGREGCSPMGSVGEWFFVNKFGLHNQFQMMSTFPFGWLFIQFWT